MPKTFLRRAIIVAACLSPALAHAQVAAQSPASPSGNSVRGAAQTAPPTSLSGPIQSNDTRPNQNQLNQGQVQSDRNARPAPQPENKTPQSR